MLNSRTKVFLSGICVTGLFAYFCFNCGDFSFAQGVKQASVQETEQKTAAALKQASEQKTEQEAAQEIKQETGQEAAQEAQKLPPVAPKPDIEFKLDINSKVIPVPRIFSPSIDLSGRGYHQDQTWPYHIADSQSIERWRKDIGFRGVFRIRWNLWDTNRGKKADKSLQEQTIANYEKIIKEISDSGGVVIVSLYGTPPGLGRALDKRSPPSSLKQWKALVKNTVRYLSCTKRYNIWYEVWDAPDTDNFFLGLKQDYLNLYRYAAEAVKELRRENKLDIPIGGPAVTWWFQNFDGNTVLTPEKSLIYELIKFCSRYKLPLDFISWHAYSTDPEVEKEATVYNKEVSELIRDWLSFFRFNKNIPLVIDEWNYDSGTNLLDERGSESYVCASYIPARLKNMSKSGINYEVFFCLEDFQGDKDEINNNRGIFFYDPKSAECKGVPKSMYNAFLMLGQLGDNMYSGADTNDEFVNLLVTREKEDIVILAWNYIDAYIGRSFISRNIALLGEKERNNLLKLIKEDKLDKLINGELAIDAVSAPDKLKSLLKKAGELKRRSSELFTKPINIKITLTNINGDYIYQRYAVDYCSSDCPFSPVEEKELTGINAAYEETLTLNPYSLSLIKLKKKTDAAQAGQ